MADLRRPKRFKPLPEKIRMNDTLCVSRKETGISNSRASKHMDEFHSTYTAIYNPSDGVLGLHYGTSKKEWKVSEEVYKFNWGAIYLQGNR